jgi:hypothetical protein
MHLVLWVRLSAVITTLHIGVHDFVLGTVIPELPYTVVFNEVAEFNVSLTVYHRDVIS